MNKTTGYARITLDKEALWVRFESVGARERFNVLLSAFRSSFPLTIWDESLKAWRLPRTELNNVTKFCDHVFGPGHIRYQQYDSIVSPVRQLVLSI